MTKEKCNWRGSGAKMLAFSAILSVYFSGLLLPVQSAFFYDTPVKRRILLLNELHGLPPLSPDHP